ncbi:MAG: hemolysin D [Cytophagales bacterium]|nr:hemolysin D [Cytophagales bacterium]
MTALPATEKANALSHASGLIFGLVALPILIVNSTNGSGGIYIFSFSFLFMFTASTVYHLKTSDISKRRWQVVDHISIYFLIAGTYTPFVMMYLEPQKGQFILQLLWSFVLIGTIFKVFFAGKFKLISTLIYLGMGWAAIFVLYDFMEMMPTSVLIWIGIGGAFYSLGTAFYLWKKLAYHHAIWHLFVLGGSVSHWYAIWISVT